VGRNELPTSITDNNTYQKRRRRSGRRRRRTTTTTFPGEVIFVHSFNHSKEIERDWVGTNCRLVLPILIRIKRDEYEYEYEYEYENENENEYEKQ